MPELPEVELTRRRPEREMAGKRIEKVVIRAPKLRLPIPPELKTSLRGRAIRSVGRREKGHPAGDRLQSRGFFNEWGSGGGRSAFYTKTEHIDSSLPFPVTMKVDPSVCRRWSCVVPAHSSRNFRPVASVLFCMIQRRVRSINHLIRSFIPPVFTEPNADRERDLSAVHHDR